MPTNQARQITGLDAELRRSASMQGSAGLMALASLRPSVPAVPSLSAAVSSLAGAFGSSLLGGRGLNPLTALLGLPLPTFAKASQDKIGSSEQAVNAYSQSVSMKFGDKWVDVGTRLLNWSVAESCDDMVSGAMLLRMDHDGLMSTMPPSGQTAVKCAWSVVQSDGTRVSKMAQGIVVSATPFLPPDPRERFIAVDWVSDEAWVDSCKALSRAWVGKPLSAIVAELLTELRPSIRPELALTQEDANRVVEHFAATGNRRPLEAIEQVLRIHASEAYVVHQRVTPSGCQLRVAPRLSIDDLGIVHQVAALANASPEEGAVRDRYTLMTFTPQPGMTAAELRRLGGIETTISSPFRKRFSEQREDMVDARLSGKLEPATDGDYVPFKLPDPAAGVRQATYSVCLPDPTNGATGTLGASMSGRGLRAFKRMAPRLAKYEMFGGGNPNLRPAAGVGLQFMDATTEKIDGVWSGLWGVDRVRHVFDGQGKYFCCFLVWRDSVGEPFGIEPSDSSGTGGATGVAHRLVAMIST